MSQFNMLDTKAADGCYVTFEMIREDDHNASPNDYLFQDPDYQAEDQARLDAFYEGDWRFVGVRAKAIIVIVRHNTATRYELASPGLWGIESDSEEDYFAEVLGDECNTLKADIAAMNAPVFA